MNLFSLRPWIELVKLHPDVESGGLTEATFAIDLGAIAAADPGTPAVYRDPSALYAITGRTVVARSWADRMSACCRSAW
jgi:hypothetical protein